MPDFRAHCTPPEREPTTLRLSPDESHHLVVVNRARRGDAVVAFDGRGTEWICDLAEPAKHGATLTVRSTRRATPLPHEITLAQALPKGPCMDAIVRKATELGAARIVPLLSERTQVQLDDDRQDKKLEKWRTAALEAAKQCGNPWLPRIDPIADAAAFIAASRDYDLKLIACLHPETVSLKTALAAFRSVHDGRPPRRVLWLIGPEGDFSPAEMNLAKNSGFAPITLGPLVLRCETAAICALSVVGYELQNA